MLRKLIRRNITGGDLFRVVPVCVLINENFNVFSVMFSKLIDYELLQKVDSIIHVEFKTG